MISSGKLFKLKNISFSGAVSKLNYPRSTARFILKKLRSKGLIEFDRGKAIQFTSLGNKFLKTLGDEGK